MKKCNVRSVIQSDFDDKTDGYVIHHVFPGSRRKTSEKYGYLYKLIPDVHQMIHDHPNKSLDLMLKREAQRHFESHYGNRDDFIREFGRSYL